MEPEIKIIVAKSAGICFGVERALSMSEKVLTENAGPVTSLGPLIHNPQTVADLEKRGLKMADGVGEVEGTVIFRSHGVSKEVQKQAEDRGLRIVDATCPLVKIPQNYARKLSQAGYFVILVGDKEHPEIKGVWSYVEGGRGAIVKTVAEVDQLPPQDKVGVICQTTLKKSLFNEVVKRCQALFSEVKVQNTICGATKDRQDAAYALAKEADCIVIVGGRNSSNTQKLYDICNEMTGRAYLIETETEIEKDWFTGARVVGITAGASTPHAAIERVRGRISSLLELAKTL